jgi:hypothetical protein
MVYSRSCRYCIRIIKVPEGVFSLGAELIDLGFDTNTAADVENFLIN